MAIIVTSSPRRKTIPGTKSLEKIVREFARRRPGYPVYLVGGAVRDRLLGLPLSDFDFAVARGEFRHRFPLGGSRRQVVAGVLNPDDGHS